MAHYRIVKIALLMTVLSQLFFGSPAFSDNPRLPELSNTAREILSHITDPNIDGDQKDKEFDRLFSLSPIERSAGLRNLAACGDNVYSPQAAIYLIKLREHEIDQLIASQVPKWSEQRLYDILFVIADQQFLSGFDTKLLQVARAIVALEVSPAPSDPLIKTMGLDATPQNLACIILGNAGSRQDRDQLLRYIEKNPTHFGGWLALSQIGGVSDSQAILAKKIYQDTKLQMRTRIAAAIALHPLDHDAEAFAVRNLRVAVADVGQIDTYLKTMELVSKLSQIDKNDPQWQSKAAAVRNASKSDFIRQGNDLSMLSLVRYLHSPSAEMINTEATSSHNPLAQALAMCIAADRWPAKLLNRGQNSKDQNTSSSDFRSRVFGWLVIRHPNLKSETLRLITPSKLTQAAEALQQEKLIDGLYPVGALLLNIR